MPKPYTKQQPYKKVRKKIEESIALKVAKYMQIQYPNIIYRFDVGADVKLTMGQAVKFKSLQGENRGYPDLFIAKPSNGFHGLYIELKKDKSEVFLKDGKTLKRRINKKTGKCHNKEQYEMLEKLNKEGYLAVYGFGFEDTIDKIRNYLS